MPLTIFTAVRQVLVALSSPHRLQYLSVYLLVILIVQLTSAVFNNQTECERRIKRYKDCQCHRGYINCGNIVYYTIKTDHVITCNSTVSVRDYELLPNLRIGNVKTLSIRNCPFPDKYVIKDALQRLGIAHIGELRVMNSFDGRIQSQQQHYEDMLSFAVLDLLQLNQVLPDDYFADVKDIKELYISSRVAQSGALLRPLQRLERLHIHMPHLAEVSGEILSPLSSLKTLILSSNNTLINGSVVTSSTSIKDPPLMSAVMLSQLTELTSFMMINCAGPLPRQFFKHTTKLESIDIRYSLNTIEKDIFVKQTQLVTLKLNYNELKSLPFGIFQHNTKLTVLSIANNNLTSLPSKLFDPLRALKILNLENNQLTTIDPNAFKLLNAKIYFGNIYERVFSGKIQLNTEATICKEQFDLEQGICLYCNYNEFLHHFAMEEKCFSIESK